MIYCKLCSCIIPDIKVPFSDKELGVGTKWKDICRPCMDIIAYVPRYPFKRDRLMY